ncbi:MAG: ABC transporter ATP-binding protein [Spirochaetales bacterium]|nr:ABC transporter ATP-binding protein [Spirochaetales bacterium]
MISFLHVSKRYGPIDALRGITFDVPPGEIYGYIGPNGAGKTTSLKILAGLITSFEGDVSIAGLSLKHSRMQAQALTGYVPQNAGFQEWRTVDHALNTFAKLSGVDAASREAKIEEVLHRFKLEEHRKRKIVHLSGGTIQKLRIAQALLHDPRVLILDEPLSGLDPASRFDVKKLLRELRDQGTTILLSSHILSDVEDVADRIGIIHNGELLKAGTIRDLRNEYRIGLVFEIETDSGEGTQRILKAMDGVERVHATGSDTVRVHLRTGVDLDAMSRQIQCALLEQQMTIRSFIHESPSLEEVYLSLTGGNSSWL